MDFEVVHYDMPTIKAVGFGGTFLVSNDKIRYFQLLFDA